jgi:uncharacterized protein YbjQ (UPF0145 family)
MTTRTPGVALTTTPSFEGCRITRYAGIVSSEAILGANLFKDILARVRDLVGGRSAAYEREFESARSTVLAELCAKAQRLGANAVVGVDLDYESVNGLLMVTASGTAVVVDSVVQQ